MTDEDRNDELIASMFDEVKEVRMHIVNGKLRVQTTDTDFVKACKRFVVAHKRLHTGNGNARNTPTRLYACNGGTRSPN